jgi:DNA-binding response OmpR family regulator
MFRILVAEDDTSVRKLICAVLKQNGFHALQAEDGVAALEVMDKEHVDLAVVDLMMPRMDGYTLTRQLRAAWPTLPIMMLTAKQEAKDKREGFIAGTDDYMTKPMDREEMVLRIKALLRRAQIASDHKLYIGDTVLDYNALTVTRGQESVQLPRKEFRLLFKLLSYPDATFTRLQLMDEIWGMESEAEERTVNEHVHRLRDRFRDWPDFEIVTVRGVGYRGVKKE